MVGPIGLGFCLNLTTSPLYPQSLKHKVGISEILVEWTSEQMILPKFSELIVETATQDSKTQQVASCLKHSCLQFLEMLEADDSHLSPSLGTALSSLTHDHTPFSGAACTQGLAGKGHSKTQPLFPQFRATLKRPCCSRAPHGMGWGLGLIHGIPASPSVQSCFLPCLTGIDLKGISHHPTPKFFCAQTSISEYVSGESNLRPTDTWQEVVSLMGGPGMRFQIPEGSVFLLWSSQELSPCKWASFLQWKWLSQRGRRSPWKFIGRVTDGNTGIRETSNCVSSASNTRF